MLQDFDYHYRVYLDKTIALIGTMAIKSEKAASDMNELVIRRRGRMPDSQDKTSWIYYCHLAGEYHETDDPIRVISVDTAEEIIFNKENLREHKNTRIEYSYGTRNYKELIEKHPTKELLIRGILYPCDKDKAIQAKDGTILAYDKSYVETNEYSLIDRLQESVYAIWDRWYQRQYNIDNKQYNAIYMGVLYQKLVEALMRIRLEMCLTNEAHSYHYRRFLASHGFLDFYLEHLTIKQAIKLYKNIRWVERYIGQRHTQRWLIEHVMTLRNLPISEYNLEQVYSNILEDVKAFARFEKVSLNGLETVDESDVLSLEQLLDKEEPLAPYNKKARREINVEAADKVAYSLSSDLKTKVLESKAIDLTDSEEVTLPNVLLDFWIEMVYKGLYKSYVNIRHPITGELVQLNGKNALLLYTMATLKYYQVDTDCIPDFTVGLGIRSKKPTSAYIRKWIPDNTLVHERFVKMLLDEYKPIVRTNSNIDFYNQAKEWFERINNWLDISKQDEDMDATTYKYTMVYRMFTVRRVSFRTNNIKTFDAFATSIAFNYRDFRREHWMQLANDLWKEATGIGRHEAQTLVNIQKAMIGLMEQLSSYSVQFIRDINELPIKATRMRSLRLDRGKTIASGIIPADRLMALGIIGARGSARSKDKGIDSGIVKIQSVDSTATLIEGFHDVSVKDLKVKNAIVLNDGKVTRSVVACYVDGDDLEGVKNPMGLPNIPGIRSYLETPLPILFGMASTFGSDTSWEERPLNRDKPREPLEWAKTKGSRDQLQYPSPKKK
jgi:virion structural protein|nr:MAG TPA: hypothetical protein [Bacteriophage sp.]